VIDGDAPPRGVILVVDDDPVIRALLRQVLSAWRVEEAADGEAGLARAQELHPDVVIADWMMPKLPGPEMVKRLRADPHLGHVPVIMLTALADVEHRTESYQSGVDHFLPKDFDPDELEAIIQRAVQRTQPLTIAAPLMQALHDRVDSRDMAEIGEAVSLLGEFQQRMLPQGEVRAGNLRLGARLKPSVIASGDFYDFIPWPGGRELGFVVGDVSGHGLAAAYFMVLVRTALRVLAREAGGLAETVSALNGILMDETPTGWFVTLFYGLADPRSHTVRYVNAGHCPAVVCRPSAPSALLEPTGPALGIFPGHAYREQTVTLEAGSHLVCATDGVIDAVRSADPETRYAWMAEMVARKPNAGPLAVAQALVEGAATDAVGEHKDDLAALVVTAVHSP
jgi:CheY-like chemotaxis protein